MTSPQESVDAVHADIRRDFLSGDHLATIVDSPPGAGKSTFVVDTAVELASGGNQVPIVAQTNAQANDLVRKLAGHSTDLTVARLHSTNADLEDVPTLPDVAMANSIDHLSHADIVVSTASKWSYEREKAHFSAAIIDEAYQMRSDLLMLVAPAFDRALFVGDPGQLDPFSPVDDSQWRGHADGPVNPAVATVRHNRPDSPVHRLPISWRLSPAGARLVSEAFYPQIPFDSGSPADQRRLDLSGGDGSSVDTAIDHAADAGWAFLELPHRIVPPTDAEAIATVAETAIRLLSRAPLVTDYDRDGDPLAPHKVAIGVAHRIQRAVVRAELDRQATVAGIDVSQVVVETANRLQGREFDVIVVLHPLSGRASTSEFHLATGRLCVLLSRHRHACIVVGRAGTKQLLDDHPISSPIWLGAPIPVPDGWEANEMVLERLQPHVVRC